MRYCRGVLIVSVVLAACGNDVPPVEPIDECSPDLGIDGSLGEPPLDGSACSDDGWCIEDPQPVATARFRASWSSGPDDVWLVGSAGAVAHHDGTGWTRVVAPTNQDLIDVGGTGPTDVWAMTALQLFHWDGTSWAARSVDCDCARDGAFRLRSLAVLGPSNVWVAGGDNKVDDICRWDGAQWHGGRPVVGDEPACGVDQYCGVLWGSSPTDVWCDLRGHWDGAAWLDVPDGARQVDDVWGTGPDDVWAVEGSGLVHWDGAGLTPFALPTPRSIHNLDGTGPDDVWGVSSETVVHWDGVSWSEVGVSVAEGFRETLVAVTAGEVVVGGSYGLIERNAQGAWTEESSRAFGDSRAQRIWGAAADDLWASSGDGLHHRDGTGWTRDDSTEGFGVVEFLGLSADDIWAVGTLPGIAPDNPANPRSALLRYDGNAWTATPATELDPGSPISERGLTAISGVATDDLWIGGYRGEFPDGPFIAHWDGEGWTPEPAPHWPQAMWSDGASSVWIAYSLESLEEPRFAIAHWDGNEWEEFETAPGVIIRDLHGFAADDVWASGEPGALLHWDGATWTTYATGLLDDLGHLWGTSTDELWVSGGSSSLPLDQAVMLRWDGCRWSSESLPTDDRVGQVFGVDGEMWALGAYLLHKE